MHIMNISGKATRQPMKEIDLFRFPGEAVKIDPEKRKRQALETAEFHAKMAPRKVKRGKDGKALIYGENN